MHTLMNVPLLTGADLLSAAGLAAIASLLVSVLKAILEDTPVMPPTAKRHDAVAILLVILVNIGLQVLALAYRHPLTGADVIPAILVGLLQAAESTGLYHGLKLGASVGHSTPELATQATIGPLVLGTTAPVSATAPVADDGTPPEALPAPTAGTASVA